MKGGVGGEEVAAAPPLEWKFSQVFGERTAGEEVQEDLKGQHKEVIITSETTFDGWWENIAHKIAKFIFVPEGMQEQLLVRTKKLEYSYKEAFKSNKWTLESKCHYDLRRDGNLRIY